MTDQEIKEELIEGLRQLCEHQDLRKASPDYQKRFEKRYNRRATRIFKKILDELWDLKLAGEGKEWWYEDEFEGRSLTIKRLVELLQEEWEYSEFGNSRAEIESLEQKKNKHRRIQLEG